MPLWLGKSAMETISRPRVSPTYFDAFPHQGVFNLIDCIDKLCPGITHAKRISKMRFDGQVDVLVDGCA